MDDLPLLLEPATLAGLTTDTPPLIVDMRSAADFRTGHIPGAVQLDYADIVHSEPPVMGLVPELHQLTTRLAALGIAPGVPVVAYDDEGNGKASRLLFTLSAMGHTPLALLNGGMQAWLADGFELEPGDASPIPATPVAYPGDPNVCADKPYILSRLGAADLALLDTRTADEFAGRDVRAARGGHIPGAVNLNWLDTMDRTRALRYKPENQIRDMLAARGATPDKEIIVYCQTHHRSAHTYWLLRTLGYPRVKGYPGAWSDWGNDRSTPVER